jgi:hypothetical protein
MPCLFVTKIITFQLALASNVGLLHSSCAYGPLYETQLIIYRCFRAWHAYMNFCPKMTFEKPSHLINHEKIDNDQDKPN